MMCLPTAGRIASLRQLLVPTLLLVSSVPCNAASVDVDAVVKTYGDIAEATYADSAASARSLQTAIRALIATPSSETLAAARQAWRVARVPYMQTEVFRFGNKLVDDWEGKVNAWPLDEGLIDYVAGAYREAESENELFAANVIANPALKISGKAVDASRIDDKLLVRTLHEAGGVEANVAIGYHAIEFLLWGQDLNGTGPGAGNRPATDFDTKDCTGGNCARRIAYLETVTDLLIRHLDWMKGQWGVNGAARRAVSETSALANIFMGLGSLTYGELAGERMKLGLMIHDPEEEHDCFSDNTHASHYYDVMGVRNIVLGTYTRTDGSIVSGPSLSDLVKAKSAEADADLRTAIDGSLARMSVIVERAKTVEAYDQMIGEDNPEGNAIIQAAIDALLVQSRALERAMSVLGVKGVAFEGSDSLDDPATVRSIEKKG